MNYFLKMNGLWASRIALVLLLGLSGFNHAAAQCRYNWSACSWGKYIMVSYDCIGCNTYFPSSCLEDLITKVYSQMAPGGGDVSDCECPYMVFWETSRNTFMTVPITQEVAGIGMKVVTAPKELTGEEVSKLPGLSKFKPFAGGDKLNLRIKDQLLVSERGNGTALRPALCAAGQSCGTLGQWTIKSVSSEKKGVFTIAQSGGTRACLSFSSKEGLSIRTGAAASGTCSEWVFYPDEMGPDGEIMSYQIRSVSEPGYALVLDPTSQQLRMVSLDSDSVSETKDGLRNGGVDMHKSWTIAPAGKNSAAKPSPMRPSKLKEMDKK